MTSSSDTTAATSPTRRPALSRALVGALTGMLGLAAASVAAPATPAGAAASHVAIVIAGQGTACVAWHSGITGDEVLNDVASVRYRSDGLIVQIGGVPSSAKADDTHFWSYWHNTGGSWRYSSSGASAYQPAAGTVEGWAFDNGGSSAPQPPSASYSSICTSDSAPHASKPPSSSAPLPKPRSQPVGRTAPPRRGRTGRVAPKPASHPGTGSTAPATRSGARAATRSPSATSGAASSPGSSSAAGATPRSGSSSLPPLTKLAAHHDAGSPLPLILTGILVVLLGGGAAVVALRRRTGRA